MRFPKPTLACLLLTFALQLPTLARVALGANPPLPAMTETCLGQPTLMGDFDLGMGSYNPAPEPMSNDFPMTNCNPFTPPVGCTNPGYDRVVCFTPTNDCQILVQNSTGDPGASIHVFSGMCVPDPTGCVASLSTSVGVDATIFPVFLTALTQYCMVAERCGSPGATMSITINQINGTMCGSLPVELQSFTVH